MPMPESPGHAPCSKCPLVEEGRTYDAQITVLTKTVETLRKRLRAEQVRTAILYKSMNVIRLMAEEHHDVC